MRAYSELYLNDAKKCLGAAFDYAVNTQGVSIERFLHLFSLTRWARLFEEGNPSVVAGMSGIELAWAALSSALTLEEHMEPPAGETLVNIDMGSPEYWVGWMLAQYQWKSGLSFSLIEGCANGAALLDMYPRYHEMDISEAMLALDKLLFPGVGGTRLFARRRMAGLSQAELASAAGVGKRSIQMYEQRVNDINRAQVGAVARMARVLGCSIEDLLEPEPAEAESNLQALRRTKRVQPVDCTLGS